MATPPKKGKTQEDEDKELLEAMYAVKAEKEKEEFEHELRKIGLMAADPRTMAQAAMASDPILMSVPDPIEQVNHANL